MAQDAQADLKESVLRALSTVTDPELDEPITDPADVRRVARYLSFLDGLGRTPTCLIVWDLDGNPPPEDEFVSTLIAGRLAKANFSLNAELCRALLESRLNREEP